MGNVRAYKIAEELGIEQDDILLAVVRVDRFGRPDGIRLDSAADLARNLQSYRSREVPVWVLRDGVVKTGPLAVRG